MPKRDEKIPGRGGDRRPSWNKWRLVPDVKIWEAVALSLNIEPEKVKHHPHGWMADARLFQESQEFKDRIFVLTRNPELCPTMVRLRDGARVDSRVGLSEFAAWAVSAGWDIPDELRRMAGTKALAVPAAAAPQAGKLLVNKQIADKPKRRDLLSSVIEKAKKGTDGSTAAVWLNLRELALAGEPPFTGAFDANSALCYTNTKSRIKHFSQEALRKRLTRPQSPPAKGR